MNDYRIICPVTLEKLTCEEVLRNINDDMPELMLLIKNTKHSGKLKYLVKELGKYNQYKTEIERVLYLDVYTNLFK